MKRFAFYEIEKRDLKRVIQLHLDAPASVRDGVAVCPAGGKQVYFEGFGHEYMDMVLDQLPGQEVRAGVLVA